MSARLQRRCTQRAHESCAEISLMLLHSELRDVLEDLQCSEMKVGQ